MPVVSSSGSPVQANYLAVTFHKAGSSRNYLTISGMNWQSESAELTHSQHISPLSMLLRLSLKGRSHHLCCRAWPQSLLMIYIPDHICKLVFSIYSYYQQERRQLAVPQNTLKYCSSCLHWHSASAWPLKDTFTLCTQQDLPSYSQTGRLFLPKNWHALPKCA